MTKLERGAILVRWCAVLAVVFAADVAHLPTGRALVLVAGLLAAVVASHVEGMEFVYRRARERREQR